MDLAKIQEQVESLLRGNPEQALPIVLHAVSDYLKTWKEAVRRSTDIQLRLAAEEALFGRKLKGVDQWRSILFMAEPYARSDGRKVAPPIGYEDIFREFCSNLESGKQGMCGNRGVEAFSEFVIENGPWFARNTLAWLLDTYGKGGPRARD